MRKGREKGRSRGRKEGMKESWNNHRENLSIFACWLGSPSIIQMEHKNLYDINVKISPLMRTLFGIFQLELKSTLLSVQGTYLFYVRHH